MEPHKQGDFNMVKLGTVSRGDLTAQEAIDSYKSRLSDKYKGFWAEKIESMYKVTITKKDGKTISKAVRAWSAEEAKRKVLNRNKGATGLGVKHWRNEYAVFAYPK